ncbi:MAG TPA: magnesium transporter, partial [Peptococcaceae bacterium]|nr:magnesium transporter [Peptococcaceae bacterium]
MLRVYRTVEEGQVSQEAEICEKAWLSLINPTEEEIQMVSEKTGITRDFLKDPLDDEERPRIEIE